MHFVDVRGPNMPLYIAVIEVAARRLAFARTAYMNV